MSSLSHVLITGGSGFIGSNFVRLALRRWPNTRITNLDALTYAANPRNLTDCETHPNYRFLKGDVRNANDVLAAMGESCDVVVHMAAESHVDRSIMSGDDFMTTNVLGSHVMLEAARKVGVKKFVYVGTDEVYGSLEPPHKADEHTPIEPNSPYSVSKAAADLLSRAHRVTYGLPVIITRASNNYGPYQHPEKFVPLFITNLLEGLPVPLYGDGLNVRNWVHVLDHCEGIARVVEDGVIGDVYNIGGANEHANIEIVRMLLELLGKDESVIRYVQDRPGHDRRYALDCRKYMRDLRCPPQKDFRRGLAETVEWYRSHRSWWEPMRAGAFKKYYDEQYGRRL